MAMALVRRLRFSPSRAHKTGWCAGCVFAISFNFCFSWFLPSFCQSPLTTAGRAPVPSHAQVDWWTGTQCYADRIAYPWTPGLCQAAHAGRSFFGRGSTQRGLKKSLWCNPFKVSQHGRALAVLKFEHHLRTDQDLNDALWQLSGAPSVVPLPTRRRVVTVMSFARRSESSSQTLTTETKKRQSLRQGRC